MRIARLVVCALSCVGFACAADAQLVRIPHTFISLSPPPGFTPTRNFGGFENRRAGWMIRVEELAPTEYPRLGAAFSSPERANALFGPDGIRITRIERLALESGDVPLAMGVQKAFFGRELVKYMALLGDPRAEPVVVMFNLSRSSTLDRRGVEAVLRSVKIDRPTTVAEWRAVLPFSVREVPPFHMTRAGLYWAWLAAFDDALGPSNGLTIIIARNPTALQSDSPAGLAQSNVRGSLAGWGEVTIVDERAEAFAGGPGHFIMASAGGRTVLYFLRVLPDHTFVRLTAAGESRALEDARAAIMDIAMSLELRETAVWSAE
jgi:hypothetical protein